MKRYFKLVMVLLFVSVMNAQQVYIDKGLQLNGLWCFPVHNNENTYLYLPTNARLAVDENKHPKFSFLRYITENSETTDSASSITDAGGGGIVTFLVLYDTPQEQIQEAERQLKQKFDNEEMMIRGPVVFESGRYALVSSILNDEGNKQNMMLATGKAPIVENNSIPLTFNISPEDSKVLMESFKMSTPDISLLFDLGFSGLSESYDATLEIDWSQVKTSIGGGVSGNVYFVGADVKLGLDQLFKDQSIKLETNGSDASMESLLNTVYDKLLTMMFEPVEPTEIPQEEQGALADAISGLVGSGGALSSSSTTGFGLNLSFQLKHLKVEGQSRLFFKGRSTVNRHHLITFNIGNLYEKYGDDKSMFKDVAIGGNTAFQQREVFVGLDGDIEKEFDRMVNSVTVSLRKKHANGDVTLEDILINKNSMKDLDHTMSMKYLNKEDSIQSDWLTYEYKTNWKFKGGGSYETPWTEEKGAMVNLFIPFKRQNISLEGDLQSLEQQGIKAISIEINYPFFNQVKRSRLTIKPKDALTEKSFEITLPNDIDEVNYSITWVKQEEPHLSMEGKDRFGLIFIDELPEN